MPLSETDICNQALIRVKAGRIQAINGTSKVETDCRNIYPQARDDVLSSYHWTFARARKSLQQVSETPAFGYDYAYQLPTDYIRAISLEDKDTKYAIEGNHLLCDLASDVNLIYTKRVEDSPLFTVPFLEAVTQRMAGPLASAVLRNSKLAREMWSDWYTLKSTYENNDNNSDNSPIEINNPYADARGS